MAIRILLALLLVVAIAIAWWAQLGEGTYLTSIHAVRESLEQGGLDPEEEHILQMLSTQHRFWTVGLYLALGVFALACAGFFVLPRRGGAPAGRGSGR